MPWSGIPATVMVDKEGVIQAVTHPQHVTKTALLDLIAGRRPDVPEKSTGTLFAVGDDGPEPVFQVLIRPSTSDRSGMSARPGEKKSFPFFRKTSFPLPSMLDRADFLIEAELPDQKYDVVINTAGSQDLLDPMLQQAVSAALESKRSGKTGWWTRTYCGSPPRRNSSLYRQSRGVTPVGPEGKSRPRASRVLRAWSHQGWVDRYSMRQDSMVLIASSCSSILMTILRLLRAIKSTLGLELVQARRQVRTLIVRNSGNGGRFEPWIHLSVAVLLAFVPLYLKRRWKQ